MEAASSSTGSTVVYEQDAVEGAMCEVVDAETQPPPAQGVARFYPSTKASLMRDLKALRRRTSNGLMSGLVYFVFARRTKGQFGHLANFVVGNTPDRPVFIVNIQTRQVVDNLEALKGSKSFVDAVYFLPSPERSCDLEGFAGAAETISMHVKQEEE